MAFSAALALSDLNDFLGPSQECILPVTVKQEEPAEKPGKDIGAAATEIQIDHSSGYYYEVNATASTSSAVNATHSNPTKLKKAEITLNDCLACSGCVTSAESVLVAMQSHEEVYKVVREQPDTTPILSIAPQSIASLAALHNITPDSCLRRLRAAFKQILRFQYTFDTTFARHISLLEGRLEVLEKTNVKGKHRAPEQTDIATALLSNALKAGSGTTAFPLLASACPGWICYAEKTHGELLPYMSAVKSPQQVQGSLVKEWLARRLKLSRQEIYHVAVMPCYDKKLEASRPDFATSNGNRDVDCVLTTGEVEKILQEHDIRLSEYPDVTSNAAPEDDIMPSMLQHSGSSSGGYLHHAIVAAIYAQPRETWSQLEVDTKNVRGEDYMEYQLRNGSRVLFRGGKCFGFRNLQNVVRKIGRETGVAVSKGAAGKAASARGGSLMKRNVRGLRSAPSTGSSGTSTPDDGQDRAYDFIEVMACPSGCVNGGGQIAPPKHPSPLAVDSEGMPLMTVDGGEYKVVADEINGQRVLSGNDWVAKVEQLYWQFGPACKIVCADNGKANHALHSSPLPYLRAVDASMDERAEAVIAEACASPEERLHFLRTQYRAIISSEVNGLAVKW